LKRVIATVFLLGCLRAGSGFAAPLAGADLSSLPRLEAAGAVYRVDGVARDPLAIFHDAGYRLVRLRLWHTPADSLDRLPAVIAFAQRVRAAGFGVLLDLHYSDTWADPGRQDPPAAWVGLPEAALADSVRSYTAGVVRAFRDAGALPQRIQLGNEIDSGLLWDLGRVGGAWDTQEQWSRLAALLVAAASGVRDAAPADSLPRIVLHVADGGNAAGCRRFFERMVAARVPFDEIGVSFYPWWHGTLERLAANLADLARRFGKPVMVAETSYPWTLGWADDAHNLMGLETQLHAGYPATPEGQRRFLKDLTEVVAEIPDGLGAAVIVWEPAWTAVPGSAGSPVENLALFDFDGDALPGLLLPAGAR